MATYTYTQAFADSNPAIASRDQIRWLVGDTEGVNGAPTNWNASDDEIAFALTEAGSVRRAAVVVADAIAGRYAKLATQSLGEERVQYGDLSIQYRDLAKRLEAWAAGRGAVPIPWAGGQTVSDKDAQYGDKDLIGTHVWPGFMDYLRTGAQGPPYPADSSWGR